MESTQVLELTQALEASQPEENVDVVVKVGSLTICGVDHDIFNKENTIGRDENCDVVINSKAVSVEHAIIEADAFGKHLIWDLGSTNKTRLGEVQLKPRVRHYLNDGARLRFANVNAVYHHVKILPPQQPLRAESVDAPIPGTPERIDEDAAAIASIVDESPQKNEEDDSDGDFFGENDSSALFMRPLVGEHSASPGDENRLCTNSTKKLSANDSEALVPVAGLPPQFNLPIDQVIKESSVCGADTSDVNTGEGDLSDLIAGSQPMFTPEKAANIYDVDTVPYRIEETPVKKNDDLNWEEIDDTISQISQEMDTIDTLIGNKELCVKFTPTKRMADSTSEENHGDSSAPVNPESSRKSTPASRASTSFDEPSLSNNPQVPSLNVSSIKSCVGSLHDDKSNIYDAETEPLTVVGTKMETNGNIFDLATQEVCGSEVENARLKAETSVYNVATQQFSNIESEKIADVSVRGDTVGSSQSPESAADISISDLPTQVARGLDGQLLPIPASDDRNGSDIPPSIKSSLKEAVLDTAAPMRNGENPIDSSMCDMLTQAADMNTTDARVLKSPANTTEVDSFNNSISELATQLVNKRSTLGSRDERETEPLRRCMVDDDISSEVTKSNNHLINNPKNELNGLGDVSLSDMLTQPVEKSSNVAVSNLVDTQASPLADVSLADLQTQIVDNSDSKHPSDSCTDVSISDLQTQVAVKSHESVPEELNAVDISISDLQTQAASLPHDTIPEDSRTDRLPPSDNQTSLAIPSAEKGDAEDIPDTEDIYNVMTQMPVSDHQLTFEESNTEKIELELDRYERGIMDTILGKSSDSSSSNVADSTSPFKTPALKIGASPKNPSDTPIDNVYLMDTQPSDIPVPAQNTVVSSNMVAENQSGPANLKLASEQAEMLIYDVETQAVGVTEVRKPAAMSVYDIETQDVENVEVSSKSESKSVYDVETQDFCKAENGSTVEDHTLSLVKAESVGRPRIVEKSVAKDSAEICEGKKSAAPITSRFLNHRYSQDANSVENRIRAMTDTNVNTPLLEKGPLCAKSTVAELLETLEGTPIVPVGVAKHPSAGASLSQNSDSQCSQFPANKFRKKIKALVYSDSEDSHDSTTVAHGKEEKPLSGLDRTVDGKTGDSESSHDSNVRCSQFPVEKVHRKVKALAYSDSEDSWDSPLLAQQKNKKPLELSTDNKCDLCPLKEDDETVHNSQGSLCNGNSMLSKKDSNDSSTPEESRLSKTESEIVSVDAVELGETSVNNDTGNSESLRLQLSDMSTLMGDKSRDIATPDKSDAVNKPEKLEANLSAMDTTFTSELECTAKYHLASLPKETEPKSPRVRTPQARSQPVRNAEKTSPETPEIPKDFFGTPLVHEKPPVRQYVNKKKLSLNASSLLIGPNASSTPLSDKDSHSIIDMEETLCETKPKADGKTVERGAESANYHQDNSSQSDTPKNVKKFRKSPIKKPSQDFQLFSQDGGDTHSSQDDLIDSQELGRGKRKRVKKNFFGFDEANACTPSAVLSPKPNPPAVEMNVATGSTVCEDSTAQPSSDVPPVLDESPEAETPRRERPRKQAFMSSDSNDARNTMERYRNDACYVKSPLKLDTASSVVETIALVHEMPAKLVNSSPGEMDLARIKNSLKASINRGFAVHKTGKERTESKSSVKREASVPRSESLVREKSSLVTGTSSKYGEVPTHEVCGVNMPKSPVRPGRGKNREVGDGTELYSRETDSQQVKLPLPHTGKLDLAGGKSSTLSNTITFSEKETPEKGASKVLTQDLNRIPKSRGRCRKDNTLEASSSCDQSSPSTSTARRDDGNVIVGRRRRGQRNKDLCGSQDSQPEMSHESQSSVTSGSPIRTRGTRKPQLSSQESIKLEKVDEQPPRKKRIRKLSSGSKHLENEGVVDEHDQKKPCSSDKKKVTLETTHEVVLVKKSMSPLKRGGGRPPVVEKVPDSPSPVPELDPPSSSSTTEPLEISKGRPNQRGCKRKQGEPSQDSQPEATSISSKRVTRRRGNVETTKSVETTNTCMKLVVTNVNVDSKQGDDDVPETEEETSQRLVSRRGTKQIASEDSRLTDSCSGSPSSSIVLSTRKRGNRNATKTPQRLDDSDVSACVPEELSATEAKSSCKTRGRPRKAVKNTVLESFPATEELKATEVPSASKTRGRRKKNIDDSAEVDNHLRTVSKEDSATEVPRSSKTRGRPKKVVEEAPDEDASSQDLSQGRRSGRTRKKKESFDELVARKEEEIRLKKLQRNSEQSPSPDKSHQLSLITPSASVASISDESAFSIPASPASSVTGKRSASRLGISATENMPTSSKRKKKEDLLSTSSSGEVKVMFTALGDKKLSAMVKKLGGKVVEKPTDCSVLVTDKVIRTVKFLCALGRGIPIVSPNWVSKSKAFSKFTDPNDSLLKDTEGERKFDFELCSSLEKARSQKLLEGYSIVTTASILPPPKEMKPIIECSGGNYLSKPPAKWGPRAVIISDPKDKAEWPKLSKNGVTPPILSAEAILSGILQQRFDIEKHRLQ